MRRSKPSWLTLPATAMAVAAETTPALAPVPVPGWDEAEDRGVSLLRRREPPPPPPTPPPPPPAHDPCAFASTGAHSPTTILSALESEMFTIVV